MKLKIMLTLITVLLVGCQTQVPTTVDTESLPDQPQVSDANLAGGIAPAGTPLPADAATLEKVKVALAAKYPAGEMDAVEIEVVEETDEFFYGLVKPSSDLNDQEGGGYVYAAKNQLGDWVIVADGQGAINCNDIQEYHFPSSMISECYSSNTGETIKR